ncbi:phospholipase D family protein [Desulfosporosinus sp. SB140]|uniref:phospholipase D family nuclease n=1 Tax=Desulfosporosinus paludis TaxID=3115649 RepID=UPI00388D51A1
MKRIIIPLILTVSLVLAGCSASTPITNAQSSSSPQVEYFFTKALQHPEQALESQINTAKSALDIAIYSLTKKDIVESIIAAKKRGVNVRIITDHIEAKSKTQAAELILLKNAGIPIKENTHPGLMHLKISIIDKVTVTTGSYNYTQNASTENDEVLVVIHDPAITSKWADEFQQMWDDTKNYTDVK